MLFAKRSISIVLVISLLVILGYGKEREEPTKSFPQTYPEGVPKEIVSEKDGAEMILIPAGEFKMGTDASEIPQLIQWAKQWFSNAKADWFEDETPRHTVYLDALYIDKYEVTNAQYAKFLNAYGKNVDAVGHELLMINSGYCLIKKVRNTYKPNAGYEDHPVIEVTWYGAATYAQFYGKRLPTEAEWEKAARGGLAGKRYPWGDSKPDGSNVNFADKNTNFHGSDITINDGYERTAPVGSYQPNGYGLYDMAGNVYEWCADEVDKNYYSKSPKNNPKGPGVPIMFKNDDFTNLDKSSLCVLRGGSWRFNPYNLRCADRDYLVPTRTFNYVGFRCSSVQEVTVRR